MLISNRLIEIVFCTTNRCRFCRLQWSHSCMCTWMSQPCWYNKHLHYSRVVRCEHRTHRRLLWEIDITTGRMKIRIRRFTLSYNKQLYSKGQSALGDILQNWLTDVSIISWAKCGRTISVEQTFDRVRQTSKVPMTCLWGAPFSNKGPIRTRLYFVFDSWPSADWPLLAH